MLQGSLLEKRCMELEKLGGLAEKVCCESLLVLAKRNRAYTFKGRVKSDRAIFSKVRRKRMEVKDSSEPNASYDPEHMTDVYGCRYITLFQTDIIPLVEDLIKLIKGEEPYGLKSPFKSNGLREVLIYSNRPENDPLSIANDVYKRVDDSGILEHLSEQKKKQVLNPPENKKSGYSSIHFIVEVPVLCKSISSDSEEEETVQIEIQLRDIFEEGWGEVQHHLLYSDKDKNENELGDIDTFKEQWTPHLNVLKAFADGCSQHASLIENNSKITGLHQEVGPENFSLTLPLQDKKLVLDALPTEAPQPVRELIAEAYDNLNLVDLQREKAVEDDYERVAIDFDNVLRESSNYWKTKDKYGYSIKYHLSLEYALALLKIGGDDDRERAREIYQEFITEYPDDAVVHFRYAIASNNLRNEEVLHEALRILDKATMLAPKNEILSVEKRRYLKTAIGVEKGFVYWALSEKQIDHNDLRKNLLDKAEQATRSGLEHLDLKHIERLGPIHLESVHHSVVNVLFYGYQKAILPHGGLPRVLRDMLWWDSGPYDEFIDLAEGKALANLINQDLYSRDSMMCIYAVSGDVHKAGSLAYLNLKLLAEKANRKSGKQSLSPLEVPLHLSKDGEKLSYERALEIGLWARENGYAHVP